MMMICGLVENNISHLWSYEDEDGFGFKYFCSLYVLITFKRQQLPFLGSEHYLEHGQSFPRDPVQTLLQEISGTAPAPFQLLTIMLERIENTIKAFNSCLIFTDQGHALEVFKVGTLHLTFIIFFIRKQNASLVNAQLPHESSFRHTMCPPQPSRFALSIFCKPRHRGTHHITSELQKMSKVS